MKKQSNQKNKADLVSRSKKEIYDAYIKNNYSNVIQDINGYYHYYSAGGIEGLEVDKNEVRNFIDTLTNNELAFLTYKSGGAAYMLGLPYVKGHSAEYGWKQFIQDSVQYTPQFDVVKQEIHAFRVHDFGKNHNFYNSRSFIDLLSDIDTSVLEQIAYEKENR